MSKMNARIRKEGCSPDERTDGRTDIQKIRKDREKQKEGEEKR